MQYEEVKGHLLERLSKELSPDLTYHSKEHTEDVLNCAEVIAESEGISGDDLTILKTAAVFHDTGFLRTYRDHEKVSIDFACEILPRFDYNPDQIAQISELIMATKIPQAPPNKIAEVLCDADLDYLGRSDYEPIADTLFKEFLKYGILNNELEWKNLQIGFLTNHKYFTQTSLKLREAGKQERIKWLHAKYSH